MKKSAWIEWVEWLVLTLIIIFLAGILWMRGEIQEDPAALPEDSDPVAFDNNSR